jgi:hypothetical protein
VDDEGQGLLFDRRFLDKHAGDIIAKPSVAIVELVANAWDAYAQRVDIVWPDPELKRQFEIKDNGKGLKLADFQTIWNTIDYNRVEHQGVLVSPPEGVSGLARTAFGKNGKGRFAAFCFAEAYELESVSEGEHFRCLVTRDGPKPFKVEALEVFPAGARGHGLTIRGVGEMRQIRFPEADARDFLASRFLANPSFHVYLNGRLITFKDIADDALESIHLDIPGAGKVVIHHIDSRKADRTTKQHGIAWWVQRRAVGECKWRGSDYAKILDGRTDEAKRFTFIVEADFLNQAGAVKDDWSEFNEDNPTWKVVYPAVQEEIRSIIRSATAQKREAKRDGVLTRVATQVNALPLLSKDMVRTFVEDVVDACPSLGENEIVQISAILAKLEKAKTQYGLLDLLHQQSPDDLDSLHDLLKDWTISMAKVALDEIQSRLRLINELRIKISVNKIDEVHELQPLFEKGLWMFGPQFESIHFTSNRGMTTVIREIFKKKNERGSRQRPDFVALPNSSVGFYSCASYDDDYHEDGVDALVIIDLKTTGLALGETEKSQVWGYVKELVQKGHLKPTTPVHGFILGTLIDPSENHPAKHGVNDNFVIKPVLYDTILKRAESRLLNLFEKVKEAPFLKEHAAELAKYFEPIPISQEDLLQKVTKAA